MFDGQESSRQWWFASMAGGEFLYAFVALLWVLLVRSVVSSIPPLPFDPATPPSLRVQKRTVFADWHAGAVGFMLGIGLLT